MCVSMEEVKSSNPNDDVDEEFQDAFDEFAFYDCIESFLEPIESDVALNSKPYVEKSSAASLRRRRFTSRNDSQRLSSSVSLDKNCVDSGESMFGVSKKLMENDEESGSFLQTLEKLDEIKLNLSSENDKNSEVESFDEENKENSSITSLNNERNYENLEENLSSREAHDADSSFLILLAGLVIKAIGFQFNLMISFFTFPIWMMYSSYMFVMDPFGVIKRGREYLILKAMRIFGFLFGNTSAFVYDWMKEHQWLFKLGVKFGWGLLWSVYVCVVLVGLLVAAFVVSGILMSFVVEEPIKIKENLNFDYTEKSPTAFVPIIGCPSADCGVECGEKLDVVRFGQMRVIPVDHKLQVTISLKLPESDYNQNLGIFQVRVDFLALDGKALASPRHPCMLLFKSQPIRLLLTFLKVAPLLTGYTSESQDLNIKFRGFTEGGKPTACLRVSIEQRAEFSPGAGIPEIYAASLTLESEQPLLKRFVWYWRRTLFIWVSMTMFTMELLITLLCCKPIIMPKVRLGENSARNGTPLNNGPAQR